MKQNRLTYIVIATLFAAAVAVSCSAISGNGDNVGNGRIKNITTLKSLDSTIDNKKKHVMVEFWSSTNDASRMVATNVAVVAGEMADKLVVARVNMAEPFVSERQLTQRYRLEGMPCFVLFENGLEVARNVGYLTKEELRTWLGNYIK